MNLPKRIKNLFSPAEKTESDVLTLEILRKGIESIKTASQEPIGDGEAVFFDEGSEVEFEQQKKDDAGIEAWYKKNGM